jgi:site-specific DNA-methyltransferase (adenine-specific)
MKYELGLLDPSWEYDNKQQNDPKRGGITYDTLSMEELYNIPLGNAFADNSILVTWVTAPKLMDEYYEKYNPISIIRNWGFRPVTFLFVWVKLNKSGTGYYSGLGRYTNSNAEYAIVARKGKGLKRLDKSVKQLIVEPIGVHSAKPQEQYSRLDRLYGDVKKVELFARDINPPPKGWDSVGLEMTPSTDIREWIKQYA